MEDVYVTAKVIDINNLPDSGLYYLKSEDIFSNTILMSIETVNGEKIAKEVVKTPDGFISVKLLSLGILYGQGYNYFLEYKDVDKFGEPDSWYIEYERIVDINERYHPALKTVVYSFSAPKGDTIEFYKDEDGLFHIEKSNKEFLFFIPKIVGWTKFVFPKGLTYNEEMILNRRQVEFHIEQLLKISESYEIVFPEEMIKYTNRGFPYVELFDFNENKIRLQESSSACEFRVWYGRDETTFSYQGEEYSGKEFEEKIIAGDFEEILELNKDLQHYVSEVKAGNIKHDPHSFESASCLFSPSFEVSVYHAKAMANKLQEILNSEDK